MPNGVELFFFKPTEGDRPVLALHGGPSIAPEEPWHMKVENLYLYHARGCGHSTRPFQVFPTKGMWPGMKILEEQLGIGAQVADVERIRRRLGVEQLDIVGHSFGGLIASMYASEFPKNVRSLTLLVPAAVLAMPPKSPQEDFFKVVGEKIKQKGNLQHVEEFEAFMKRYLDFGSLPQETDQSLAKRQNEFAAHYARAEGKEDPRDASQVQANLTGGMACYANFLSLGIEHDYVPACKELLSKSTFPVAIVHGGSDMMPESTSRKYIELFPKGNVTFEVIPRADHMLPEHPRAAEIVKECMARAK